MKWFERFLHRYTEKRGTDMLLMETKTTGNPVGHAGLLVQEVDGKEELEIGYWLARNHWGNGYALEAAAFLKRLARDRGEPRVISIIHPHHVRSQNVAIKNGLEWEKSTTFRGKEFTFIPLY